MCVCARPRLSVCVRARVHACVRVPGAGGGGGGVLGGCRVYRTCLRSPNRRLTGRGYGWGWEWVGVCVCVCVCVYVGEGEGVSSVGYHPHSVGRRAAVPTVLNSSHLA